jgi:hypothetical protein
MLDRYYDFAGGLQGILTGEENGEPDLLTSVEEASWIEGTKRAGTGKKRRVN